MGREIHNQVLAYAHAAWNFGGAFRWMAFIDADEFLVPKQAASIPEALAHLGDAVNVSLPWHMFGRSGHQAAPEGGVLQDYLRRARDPMSDVRGVRAFKVIVDPCHLTALRVHSMETDGSGRTCNDAGVAVEEREREKPGFYSAAHLQLNHYYTRSEAELAAKIGRGPNLAAKRGEYERKVRRTVANIEADEVEDRAALDYLARIGWEAPCGRSGRRAPTRIRGRSRSASHRWRGRRCRRTASPSPTTVRGRRRGRSSRGSRRRIRSLVRHVWHEDAGFRKNAILNRAIATSEAEFLVFIDGDVLVRPDFFGRHLELARPDRWSSGSLIRLDAAATAAVTEALVASGRVFERDWLRANRAIDRFGTWLKARPLPSPLLAALDRVTPVQKAWGGANSSAFRAAILKVNGFDESMKYGGEDKDLGVRLTNSGVSGQHLRYTASVVHLDHARGYADPAVIRANKARVRQARRSGKTWTADGIVKGEIAKGAA